VLKPFALSGVVIGGARATIPMVVPPDDFSVRFNIGSIGGDCHVALATGCHVALATGCHVALATDCHVTLATGRRRRAWIPVPVIALIYGSFLGNNYRGFQGFTFARSQVSTPTRFPAGRMILVAILLLTGALERTTCGTALIIVFSPSRFLFEVGEREKWAIIWHVKVPARTLADRAWTAQRQGPILIIPQLLAVSAKWAENLRFGGTGSTDSGSLHGISSGIW
jgi:hypothetical protein